jgi:hypothetical protein
MNTSDQIPVTGDDGGGTIGMAEKDFQVPLPENPLGAHVEFQALAVAEGPPGEGVQLVVEEPGPKSWVTARTMICKGDRATGRAPCRFYAPMLTEAEGKIAGFEAPKQIHRFCLRLASQSELMKIGELSIFACLLREPASAEELARRDPDSVRMIEEFEAKQENMSRESARESGEMDI